MTTATKSKEPWEMSASQYQLSIGVHQPWIAEISIPQYAGLSKRAKREYDAKRAKEWQASADAKTEWRNKVMEAYDKGIITKNTPNLHPDARSAITLALIAKEKQQKETTFDKAYAENHIKSISELNVGDRVYDIMTRSYGKVEKTFKNSVRIRLDEPLRYAGKVDETLTVNVRQLQRKSYDDLKAEIEKPAKPEAALPKAEPKAEKVKIVKPEKQPVPGPAELQRIHASRSPLSQSMDNRQRHSVIVEPSSPRVKVWIRDAGRMDIKGIDTPSSYKMPKTRRQSPSRMKVKKQSKSTEINLGAGIVRSKRRQHIRLR